MKRREEIIGDCRLILGDCLEVLPEIGRVDCAIVDPPYGTTACKWDKIQEGWPSLLKTNSLWSFGSLRYFFNQEFTGWKYAQDIIWEKHNGSNMRNDRFRCVHEMILHFYKGEWGDVFKSPVYTPTAMKKSVIRRKQPTHFGKIDKGSYETEQGGPQLMRSVIYAKSCHGYAEHPTQKPLDIVSPLVEYSCPRGGVVIDPFMGSGTTGVSCAKLGRKFIGIEISEEYFDIACRRIEEAYKQPDLFIEPIGAKEKNEIEFDWTK